LTAVRLRMRININTQKNTSIIMRIIRKKKKRKTNRTSIREHTDAGDLIHTFLVGRPKEDDIA
jgi:hypothetical protein